MQLEGRNNEENADSVVYFSIIIMVYFSITIYKANTRIKTSIGASKWTDEEKRKALLASRYLNSVSKGSNALELNVVLMANLDKPVADRKEFHVPQYIVDALTWLLS